MGWIIGAIVVFIIWKVLANNANRERNQQNGADIRALCTELGVPSESYNDIVIKEMGAVKHFATLLGQSGSPHVNTPWNVRMALAIADIHHQTKKVNDKANELEDLIVGLQDFIVEYRDIHGYLPQKIMIDIKTHEQFLNSRIYNFQENLFSSDIEFIPTILNDGRRWKVSDSNDTEDETRF
jgi:hypothetical protein